MKLVALVHLSSHPDDVSGVARALYGADSAEEKKRALALMKELQAEGLLDDDGRAKPPLKG